MSHAGPPPDNAPVYQTPQWVKVFGALALALMIIVAIIFVVSGGEHGPGRHLGGHAGPSTSPAVVTVTIMAANFAYQPNELKLGAGDPVTIVLAATDMRHTFTLDELDVHIAAEKDASAIGALLTTVGGRYTFYCAEPGHREAGMEGVLVVEEGPD